MAQELQLESLAGVTLGVSKSWEFNPFPKVISDSLKVMEKIEAGEWGKL